MKIRTSSTVGILAAAAATAAAFAFRTRTLDAAPFLGKVVLVTGGSRGLGFALANRFAAGGAKLALASRSHEELAYARDRLLATHPTLTPDDVLLIPSDLRDPAQATGLIVRTIAHFGCIDVLINNAGVIEVGPVENQTLDAYTRAMETNFYAALYTTHAALPHLLDRAQFDHTASSIVNIASIGGKMPVPHMIPYVASKFALVGFSETLHAELRHKGIRVTTVCPGLMRTGGEVHAHFTGQVVKEKRWFMLSAQTPLVAASVEHAANKIYRAVAAGSAEITITPQAWLAARFHGLAPAINQGIAALANEYILPAPAPETVSSPSSNPAQLHLL